MTTNTSTVTTLSLIRELIAANRRTAEAVTACDNHYQAGYDRGYEEQYQRESSELHREYMFQSEIVDAFENTLFDHLGQDCYDFHRARLIASKYA
jgi:predicted dinucleotide-binding enzyme